MSDTKKVKTRVNKEKVQRANTQAKTIVRKLEQWLNAEKNREIVISWRWNSVNRFDRSGVIIARENGEDLFCKIYKNGNMHLPNPDFRRTNSRSHRCAALESLYEDLVERDNNVVHVANKDFVHDEIIDCIIGG